MNVLRVIIIDDEKGSRELLKTIINKNINKEVEVVAEAENVEEAYEKINTFHPDLIFLDIQMPGKSGFDLLRMYTPPLPFGIIFVTAYDQYAIQAIRHSAHDYLMKPVDKNELIRSIERYKTIAQKAESTTQQIEVLFSHLNKDSRRKIAIPDHEGYTFVYVDDIIRLQSDGNYTILYLNDGKKIVAARSIGDFENLLDPLHFLRVHRSHIININHIKKYYRGEGGYVVLSDNSQVEISRRKKNEFIEKLRRV